MATGKVAGDYFDGDHFVGAWDTLEDQGPGASDPARSIGSVIVLQNGDSAVIERPGAQEGTFIAKSMTPSNPISIGMVLSTKDEEFRIYRKQGQEALRRAATYKPSILRPDKQIAYAEVEKLATETSKIQDDFKYRQSAYLALELAQKFERDGILGTASQGTGPTLQKTGEGILGSISKFIGEHTVGVAIGVATVVGGYLLLNWNRDREDG